MPSRVVGARFHPEHEDEAQALHVLEDLQAQGWSTRQILTAALLALNGQSMQTGNAQHDETITQELRELRELVAQMRDMMARGVVPAETPEIPAEPKRYSPELVKSLASIVQKRGG